MGDEHITFDDIAAMRQIIGVNGASPNVVRGIATQFECTEGYVALVCEAMREEGARIGDAIFESVGPRTAAAAADKAARNTDRQRRAQEVVDLVNRVESKGLRGASNQGLAAVAASVGVIGEPEPVRRTITESEASDSIQSDVRRAEVLVARVTAAQKDLPRREPSGARSRGHRDHPR